jgi:hypothetical protein
MPSLELFEIDDRAVARRGDRAWAFNPGHGWRDAPGLIRKASLVGISLEPEEFARHFPEATRHAIPQAMPERKLFRFFSHS